MQLRTFLTPSLHYSTIEVKSQAKKPYFISLKVCYYEKNG
jgi:hypothetical protein